MEDEHDEPGWFATRPAEEYVAALKEGMDKAIATASPDFGAALRRLEEAVAAVSPFDLVCVTSLYFLTVQAGINPEFDRPEGIFQNHVELIHAFALRRQLKEATPVMPLQQGLEEVLEATKGAVNAFMVLETARIAHQQNESRRVRGLAIASMRVHAATVRGWSYYTDLSQVLTELYAPLEAQFETALGVRPSRLVEWWWAVTAAVEDRIAVHRERVRKIATAPLDDAWPAVVQEVFARLPTEPDEELIERLRADEDQRRGFAVIAGDLNLYRVFGFALEELLEYYPGPVDQSGLERVLDAWSLPFGGTAEVPLHELLFDNPVLSRPVVRLQDGLYLWVLAPAFNHSAFAMLERLFAADPALWESYVDRRAEYLENRVAGSLSEKFPTGRVVNNVVWTDPADGKTYETDVLVLLGSHALIVECKSGRLSRHTQKGRGRWLRDDIDELVVAPARQAKRFANFLIGQSGRPELATRSGEHVVIEATEIREVITVGATLEPLAGLLPSIRGLVDSGLTDEGLESLTHSVTLFDLLVILEMLDHPSEVIHYISRRSELEKSQFLVGEETDLLGFYLRTGFNLGSAEFESAPLAMRIIGLSDAIDTYHYKLESGIAAEKPSMRRTDWWEQLLSTVEKRAGPRWTELGLAMCNVAYEEQQEFEEAFVELQSSIREGRRAANEFVLFANGPTERRDYFIGLVASQVGSEERQLQMQVAARKAMSEHDEIKRVLLIGWPPVRQSAPYQVLAMFER